MKKYPSTVLTLVSLAVTYGFIVPSLLSMKDSLAVIAGIVIGGLGAALLVYFAPKLFESPKDKK